MTASVPPRVIHLKISLDIVGGSIYVAFPWEAICGMISHQDAWGIRRESDDDDQLQGSAFSAGHHS